MSLDQTLEGYFDAWNARDPEAVVAALSTEGTYEYPTMGGPESGDALAGSVGTLMWGFPDVHFELMSIDALDVTRAAAQRLMKGTNTGAMPTGPATGQAVVLPGADFFDYDLEADRMAKVVGQFDTATLLSQLGLQAHITSADMDRVTKFGFGLRVNASRTTIPGALSVTLIDIDPDQQFTLSDATTKIVMEQLGNEAYLGSYLASIG